MTGQLCPECGTPRTAEDRPGCDCGERGGRSEKSAAQDAAQDAVQDAVQDTVKGAKEKETAAGNAAEQAAGNAAERAAEIAAAEDFDPLRIRPYVTLDAGSEAPRSFRTAGPLPPLAPTGGSAAPPPPVGASEDRPVPPPVRRKRYRAAAIGAAAVAVIGTVAFAGKVLSQDAGEDQARPGTAHTWLPSMSPQDTSPSAVTPTPTPPPPTTPPTAPSAAAPPPPAPATTPSASRSSGAKTPSPSATKTMNEPSRESGRTSAGSSLGPGDSGPEVVELQRRLAQIRLFHGSPDGRYDDRVAGAVGLYQSYKQIADDPQGVYGPDTRRALEADTRGTGGRH
ncbi:peptidoglycan-binding protein [Streptomyces sp. NPDC102274]|uniref:peptidoglycan-binding domain-containing protein n=1 Tax=Streptomyces sp. NPDC102274 TaxID=3366151 RepID=UPI0037F49564